MFDLLSTAELTASAAVVTATLAALFGRTVRERATIAIGLTAWFVAVLWLGSTDALHFERGLGVPGLGAAVALPIAVILALALGTQEGRTRVAAAPLPPLVAVQAVRVLGVSFVLLHLAGRLPAPFAPVAGWGDIFVGALALPVAAIAARDPTRSRDVVLPWTIFGIADLIAAVTLGVASSPGPVRIFMQEPGSDLMTSLPWIVIPCFLVPALFAVHLVTLYKLRRQGEAALPAPRGA